ncbi:MAG: hypothetical protein CYPHOPRED_003083 [Cyphobasidiales sp. Tagirdzhanova-0007]|nr:MAG: hypothetical protein CYPHOPRED_003083 [Cyphobasidiales sp. Tagirdzhanova-0007]
MRRSTTSALVLVAAYAANNPRFSFAQSAPGEPTTGQTSVPISGVTLNGKVAPSSVIPQPGEPTIVVGRQDTVTLNGAGVAVDASTTSYNDGLYTPWTLATEAATPATTAASDSTVFLQPTTSSLLVSESATPSSLPATTLSTTEAEPTTTSSSTPLTSSSITPLTSSSTTPLTSSSTTPLTSSSSSLSSDDVTSSSSSVLASTSSSSATSYSSSATSTTIPSSSSTSTSSTSQVTASPSSSSTSSLVKASPISDTANSTLGPKGSVILPVAVSLGVLAVLLSLLLLYVWRRKLTTRRLLNQRRYGEDDVEKGEYQYGNGDEDDGHDEKDMASWATFGPRNDHPNTQDGANAGGRNARAYQGMEEHDDDERGWKWGIPLESASNRGRGPLPMTPAQHKLFTTAPADSAQSLHNHLDAMMAESRTGYDPYMQNPQRANSLTRVASGLLTSLSARAKKFGSKASSHSAYSTGSGKGQWTEHGVWEADEMARAGEQDAQPLRMSAVPIEAVEDAGQKRPLLACVDETPRKGGYSTYTPPDTPTRSPTSARYRTDTDDTDLTMVGTSSAKMAQSLSGNSTTHAKRFALRDDLVPAFSPRSPGSSKRYRAKTVSESDCDTPSMYSPSACSHGQGTPKQVYPAALQPGMSPALGSRPVSPAIRAHPYNRAVNQPKRPNLLSQSTRSGTTYSLGSMAGLLHGNDSQQSHSSYTDLPARKPRRQSQLSKHRPVMGGSPSSAGAIAGESSEGNPHRAISRVVKASRVQGSSIAGSSESGRSSPTLWNQQVRHQLRESNSSGSSINDLLHNVLGPVRSPA